MESGNKISPDSTKKEITLEKIGVKHHYDSQDIDSFEGNNNGHWNVTEVEPIKITNVQTWFRWVLSWMIPGFGMFLESFIIFSTGQLKTIWKSAYPTCWSASKNPNCPNLVKCNGLFNGNNAQTVVDGYCNSDGTYPSDTICDEGVLDSISYTEFAGIMLGMVVISLIADKLGRRIGSITTASIMLCGAVFMTFSIPFFGLNIMFIWFTTAFFVYGFGIGGEYPVSGSSAAERSQQSSPSSERGKDVALTFSLQGMGAVVGSLVVTLALVFTSQSAPDCSNSSNNEAGYDQKRLEIVWRVVYGFGSIMALMVLLYRFFFLKESEVWKDMKNKQNEGKKEQTGEAKTSSSTIFGAEKELKYDLNNTWELYYVSFRYYWPRLLATAGCWFLWDVCFDGNKLYSAEIFGKMVPDGNLISINLYILLNNVIAWLGYFGSAYVIDKGWCGRVRLQLLGFGMVFILFTISTVLFDSLPAVALLSLYVLSSFFGQFGPNVTTYVSAAELYPTPIRSTCHGISAFCGKSGALFATILFGFFSVNQIFLACAAVAGIGFIFTFIFLPNTANFNLIENDRYFEAILHNEEAEYQGECRNPKYCSNFEIWRGHCKNYDPDYYERKYIYKDEIALENVSLNF
eukprot:Awhi_evm1s15648